MNHKIIRTALALLFVSLLIAAPRAQQPAPVAAKQSPEDRIALHQALLDLTNPWTVMCIAAHPDDEDGTSLIVMRRKYGAHTVSLFSTFGEGGQNAVGPELYEEMGAIRARETMAAAEIQGSEPHFLGLKDFGYSKSADEAFKFWGHEEALRRMVLQIRQLRPDVIITNHSATNNDHGHHQATARLELEAFDAAADPKRFPEQLSTGLQTWQVQRLFVRAGRSNQAPADASGLVSIDPNELDTVRGTVFAEEALRALQKHATQGPWPKTFADMLRFRNSQDGKLPLIRYRLTREAKGAETLPAESHNFLDGLRLPKDIAEQVKAPTINGQPLTDPTIPLNQIVDALSREWKRISINFVKVMYGAEKFNERAGELYFRRVFLANLLVNGLSTELSGPSVLIPGHNARFTFVIKNNGSAAVRLKEAPPLRGVGGSITLPCCDGLSSGAIAPGESRRLEIDYQVPAGTRITVPHSLHLYDEDPFGTAVGTFVDAEFGESIKYPVGASKWFDVAPAVEIAGVSPSALVITPQTAKISKTLTLQVINHERSVLRTSIGALIGVDDPATKRTAITEEAVTIRPDETREIKITLPMQPETTKMLIAQRRVYTLAPPPTTLREMSPATPAPRLTFRTTDGKSNEVTIPIVYADAGVASNLHVGYIRGFDFSLPNALAALGVESKELSVDEVKTTDLSMFTSIIVDNRVYESQPELIAANQKLLDYANTGGTLIVFYHKSNEWNPDERRKRPQLAPYKLLLGDERVTDETAPITFIEPEHPLLNFPNKMGQEDFVNWIQERGLYYPREWDPQFHALLQSNDPGETPLKGGLLVADYGRGHYIYTSMVWYRELRGGVPGAYRMLANMISYGRK